MILLQSSEDVSQMLSTPESSKGSQTRKGRGRGKVSSEQEPRSDLVHEINTVAALFIFFPVCLLHFSFLIVSVLSSKEVAETPAKKSRRGKEPSVAQSPSLRQGKQAAESNPRVIFTGLVDKQGEKVDCSDTLFKPIRFIWY